MDLHFFVPLLATFTLLAGIAFAIRSERKLKARRADPNIGRSSLASDSNSHVNPET